MRPKEEQGIVFVELKAICCKRIFGPIRGGDARRVKLNVFRGKQGRTKEAVRCISKAMREAGPRQETRPKSRF